MKPKLLLILIPFLLLLSCTKQTEKSAPDIKGEIVNMEGDVTLAGKSTKIGDPVSDESVIQTGADGYCEIQFLDSNIIRVFEDSIIRISFSNSTVSLDRGAAAAVLRNLSSLIQTMDDVFTIKSGTVVAGIRGTSFYVKREDADTSYFCLCNGKIHLSDGNDQFSKDLESTHHLAVRISEKNRQLEVSNAPMLYHSDKDMEDLAGVIGQKMDWNAVESYH
ncbi:MULTISPECIES: FecR domain-containing protein [unclassified Oceanispirochaeta]|uniref:FecR family protein n=1 Tax=unclassified Oceanispirochaeta TaxID=2635722 RepID=UPI000E091DE7|nr:MULTISPECIES: FecR family protein [unclassified Oceanispirochaeta]MBF9018059.1 FecR domain-containing protein [Oceanispirochaeta sp. M2]NPD73860.1 FecR domain-containing protein [Oceanispirochaeta sp. M1]RDG30321.1 hypothetical protein DV872_17330 [Oceanispirochaeta sp. M1]